MAGHLDDEVGPEAARLEAMRRRELAQAVERVGRDEMDRAEVEECSGRRAKGRRYVRDAVAFFPLGQHRAVESPALHLGPDLLEGALGRRARHERDRTAEGLGEQTAHARLLAGHRAAARERDPYWRRWNAEPGRLDELRAEVEEPAPLPRVLRARELPGPLIDEPIGAVAAEAPLGHLA